MTVSPRAHAVTLAVCAWMHGCASPRGVRPTTVSPVVEACVHSLTPLRPPEATQWLFVRPRAMFEHPRLGPALDRASDDASERALVTRSRRLGYDLRAVDLAMLAWMPDGELAVGLGAFDAARMVDLLWERLLPPRRRGASGPAVTRMEGVLQGEAVALAVQAVCGVAAWATGDTRRVDRAVLPGRPGNDPNEMLVWHAREIPDAVLRPTDGSLLRVMHDIEVRADATGDGVTVAVTLEGDVPTDGEARIRTAVGVLAESPLGAAVGAGDWLARERVTVTRDEHHLGVRVVIPWRGVDALADVLRGSVGASVSGF